VTFEELQYHNEVVRRVMLSGGTPEDCCIALAAVIDAQQAEIVRLLDIAPRKIRMQDGGVMIWRCPDEFVPDP
jgi:hypothetical protein